MTQVTTQTPLQVLNAGEDGKYLSSTGINTDGGSGEQTHVVLDSEHSNFVLQVLNDLRVAGQLIDVIFVDVAGKKAKAHRSIVAAVCTEFETLITGSPSANAAKASSLSKPLEIQLPKLHPALEPVTVAEVEFLLDFIYTGQSGELAQARVPTALVLCHMLGVRGRLNERVRARVDPAIAANIFHLCVGKPKATKDQREAVWDGSGDPLPVSPTLAGLLALAQSLLTRSFVLATGTAESMRLMDERTLKWLIRQDGLHVCDEASVFEAVLNWAETDKARIPLLTLKGVFSEVRFGYMTKEAVSKAFWRLSCIVGVTKIDPNVILE